MRKILCIVITGCLTVSFLYGCSCSRDDKDKRLVAQVNKYKMMVEDLRYELKNIPYDSEYPLKTEDGRKEYMDRLVEKEILLQEAQRLALDKEEDFMKTIEAYWEQALLKKLLQKKSREIAGGIHIYDNEIEEYYKNSGERLPLSQVKLDIRRVIRQRKETEVMTTWIEELKKGSYIKINKELLEEVFSNSGGSQ